MTVGKNASLMYNDAYMARALVPAFMYEAVSLVDEYSLARAKRMAHSNNMDLDGYAVFFFLIFFKSICLLAASAWRIRATWI